MPERSERIILGLCVVVAAGHAAFYLALSVQRIGYPFELEWMESGSLEHAMRVLRGDPLYVAPSIEFVPFPYPPLYAYVSAAVAKLVGADLLALRLVSWLSSLGVAAIVGRFVQRESGSAAWGFSCAGLFLATWRASGLYFDVGRLDSFFALLLLASVYLLRFAQGRRALASAALLGSACVMTKQTGAAVFGLLALWCLWADWRRQDGELATLRSWERTRYFTLPLLALVVTAVVLLELRSGYFLRYVIAVQPGHAIKWEMLGWFFGRDLLATLPVVSVAVAAWLWMLLQRGEARSPQEERVDRFHLLVLAGVLVACIVPRIKAGGAANNLIPIYAWLSVMFGVAISRAGAWLERARPGWRPRFGIVVGAAALLQLAMLARVPDGYLPSAEDRETGRRLEAYIAGIEGEVLLPVQAQLAARAGKRVYAHQMPATDYLKSGLPEAEALRKSYVQAVRDQRFAAIVDSNTGFLRRMLPDGLLEQRYELKGWLVEDASVLLPISGAQIRAGTLWLPRAD